MPLQRVQLFGVECLVPAHVDEDFDAAVEFEQRL